MTFGPGGQAGGDAPAGKQLPVSVVIAAYNASRFVGAAVESAAGQTSPPAEIIVVDDGSTDDTAAIAASRGARVIHQSNSGPSSARNAGILAAVNPWIAFLDADDVWTPEKLAWQWRALLACPDVACAFGDFVTFDEEGSEEAAFLFTPTRFNLYPSVRRSVLEPSIVRCEHDSLIHANVRGNFIPLSTLVVRRDVLIEAGLFDTTISFSEDHDLEMRVLAKTTAVVVERVTMRYRRHGTNSSADKARMLVGEAAVAERVLAHPERYPAQAAEYLGRIRPTLLRAAGRSHLAAGRFSEAEQLLRRSWEAGPNPFTAMWLGVARALGARERWAESKRA